ncbi:MAG: hypothetical protein IJQ21_02485 [Lachnospiraceae bacterium]|nr:hypothetical protein [Lachnospiraceae bacterium]
MFLIQEKRKRGTHLCIVQSYRDPVSKKTRKKRIRNLGYLEDLKQLYDDPVAYFTEEAQRMSREHSAGVSTSSIAVQTSKRLRTDTAYIKNYGYAALAAIYHSLKLDIFLRTKAREQDLGNNLHHIVKMYVYGAFIFPDTINRMYDKRSRLFEKTDFPLDEVFRSLSGLLRSKTQLQGWIHENVCHVYGRKRGQAYYYISNHYFEVPEQDRVRLDGSQKGYRMDPIVRMGLFVDEARIPISYELLSDSAGKGEAFVIPPAVRHRAEKYGIEKITVVADTNFGSAMALYPIRAAGDDYIISPSIRDAGKEMKEYVIQNNGWKTYGDDCRIKSRISTKRIQVTNAAGKKESVSFEERQIVYYNPVHARWARAEREGTLLRVKDFLSSPGILGSASPFGLTQKTQREIEAEMLEEEKYDGYYLILTNRLDDDDETIFGIYRDLWDIQSFCRMKDNTFEAHPKYFSRREIMQTHYLVCYIALILVRILEQKTEHRYALNQIIRSLKKCNCVYVEENYFVRTYFDEILDCIGKYTNIDFSKKYLTLGNIRKSLGLSSSKT